LNKPELVEAVAEKAGITKKDSEKAVAAVLEGIAQLVGFGTFEVRHRNAREGRNPSTGEAIKIAAQNVPAFKPGKALKDLVK